MTTRSLSGRVTRNETRRIACATSASARYRDFIAAIANPGHDEHESVLVWIGGAFDPGGFDINSVNRGLRRLRI